jgi:hypothetical protein
MQSRTVTVIFLFRHVTELSKTFPDVEMVFGNGQKILLSPENYLFKVRQSLLPSLSFLLYGSS